MGTFPDSQCLYKDNKLPCFSKTHVLSLMREETLHEFSTTPTPNGSNDYRSKKAYALDTEHVYTHNGLEVARVTLVDMKRRPVMDSYVLPKHTIHDFNTEYSGIVGADLAKAITLEQCHQQLFQFVNAETILIGHSLEADLKALRLCHHNVVDTAVVFAKKVVSEGKACIKKVALRKLAESLLGRKIQSGTNGHCSIEDATADLLAQKIKGASPVHTSLTESSDQSSSQLLCAPHSPFPQFHLPVFL